MRNFLLCNIQQTDDDHSVSLSCNLPHKDALALQIQALDAQLIERHFDACQIVSNKLLDRIGLCECDLTHSCAAMSAQGHILVA